jgi:hypothetical protein
MSLKRKEGSWDGLKRAIILKGWNLPAFCPTGPDKTLHFGVNEHKEV